MESSSADKKLHILQKSYACDTFSVTNTIPTARTEPSFHCV